MAPEVDGPGPIDWGNDQGGSSSGGITDPALIKIGTEFVVDGVTLIGTYDGSDRWDELPEARVDAGFPYKSNSLEDNMLGTLDRTTDPVTIMLSDDQIEIDVE